MGANPYAERSISQQMATQGGKAAWRYLGRGERLAFSEGHNLARPPCRSKNVEEIRAGT
jgi:hypothetical protein